jgi:hypothetical protein
LKEGDTDSLASPDPDKPAANIWGEQPASRPAGPGESVPSDIWGSGPQPESETTQDEPVSTWPDVWGDTPRGDQERQQGSTRPVLKQVRFSLPETWAAPPKTKLRWRPRLRRT